MPPRIGIIGAGIFGTLHLQVFTQLLRQGQVSHVVFADPNPETVARQSAAFGVRGYSDLSAMLAEEKLDAVTVVTPDFAHRPVALQALAAGCHVLVEKPMDVTVAGCDEMIAAARQAGKLLQVDFHKRFDPYHIETYQMARQGQLGASSMAMPGWRTRIEVPRDWFATWVHAARPAGSSACTCMTCSAGSSAMRWSASMPPASSACWPGWAATPMIAPGAPEL